MEKIEYEVQKTWSVFIFTKGSNKKNHNQSF